MVNEFPFYFLDDKLLYACSDFIGFDPQISKPLTPERLQGYGTKVTVDEFNMRGSLFTVILINFRGSGPLRGHTRIEILKEGRTLILYKEGGGLGGVYTEGSNLLVQQTNAYLVADGHTLKKHKIETLYPDIDGGSYYFFWFADIIIPVTEQVVINYDSLPEKEFYNRGDIKQFRQTEWHAKTVIDDREVVISRSSIPGFLRMENNSPGYERFRKNSKGRELIETKIMVDGIDRSAE